MRRIDMEGLKPNIAVIGGGSGGLTAALSLLRCGFDVHVYEQAKGAREVGAGLALTPNATRILYRLGLGGKLAELGVRPRAWRQRRWDDGRTLQVSHVETNSGEPAPFCMCHRADLLSILMA